jgi:glutamate-1-semialdehyde 2,1-aminomutase
MVVHPGGVTAMYGVQPDIVCLAKALGGGVPCGAVGGTAEVMEAIADGRYDQVGTFNGNPLTMAAARAVLTEVLTPDSYVRAEQLGRQMLEGSLAALRAEGQAAYGAVFGFKGSVVFHETPCTNYREFLEIDLAISHCHFLYQHNGGVFLPPWGKSESWTLCVSHSDADGERYVDNVARLAHDVAPIRDRHSDIFGEGQYN